MVGAEYDCTVVADDYISIYWYFEGVLYDLRPFLLNWWYKGVTILKSYYIFLINRSW